MTSVQFTNVPSFVDKLDQVIEVEGLGSISVDTAYGGDSFCLVDAGSVGFSVSPDEAHDMVASGQKIIRAANEQIGFSHPENKNWSHLSFCMLTCPIKREGGQVRGRNTVVIQPGKLDRSPCGTGCSARMAVLHERGLLMPGDRFVGESVINSEFNCQIEEVTQLANGKSAIVPSVAGRAWITGTHQHMLDPKDPWPSGYRLSDTWPTPVG